MIRIKSLRNIIFYYLSNMLKKVWPIIILSIIIIIFFWKFFFIGYLPIGSDYIAYHNYPWKYYYQGLAKNPLLSDPLTFFYPYKDCALEYIRKNKISLWNPYICCGMPGYNISTFFRIPNFLAYFLPTPIVYSFTIILPLFLAGLFMYLFLKYSIKLSEFGALVGSITFMLNGVFMVWLEFESVVQNAFLFPLELLFIDKTITKKSLLFSILTAIVLVSILFSSHLYFIYSLLILIFYSLFRLGSLYYKERKGKELIKAALFISIAFPLGFLLSSVYFLPTFEQFQYSHRQPLKFEELNPLPWYNLITFIIPDFYGTPAAPHYNYRFIRSWFYITELLPFKEVKVGGENYNEYCGYIGVLPLLLAFIGGLLRRGSLAKFFFLGWILSLVFALGTPLYLPLYYLVPGLSRVGISRILILYVLFGSILAGLGADYIINHRERLKNNLALRIVNITLLVITGTWVSTILYLTWMNHLMPPILAKHFNIFNPSMHLPIFFLFASIFIIELIQDYRVNLSKIKSYITLIIVIDLFIFGTKYNPMTPPELLFPTTESIQFLQERQLKEKEPFRIVAFYDTLPPNTNIVYRLQSVEGYEASYPKRYYDFIKELVYPNIWQNWVDIDINSNRKFLRLLNVKYILTPYKERPKEGVKLVFDRDIAIYEDEEVIKRAFIVPKAIVLKGKDKIFKEMKSKRFKPDKYIILEEYPHGVKNLSGRTEGSTTKIISYEPEKVVIEANLTGDGFLVLSDSYYPGWKVFVDGKEDKILKANYIMRAVKLDKGYHKIEFIYDPPSFKLGLIISLSTFLFIIILIISILLRSSVRYIKHRKENRR